MPGLQLISLLLAASPPTSAPEWFNRLPTCASAHAPIEAPCTLSVRFSPPTVTRLLGRSDQVWWIDGDRLTLIGRFGEEGWAVLCCALSTPLEPIGETGFGSITVRIPHVREALFDVGYMPHPADAPAEEIRGPDAPLPPPAASPLRGTIAARTIRSAILNEVRTFSVYMPPDIAPGVRLPVLYLADGDTRRFAPILEAAIADGRAAPAILVGTYPAYGPATGCVSAPCDRRMLEYLVNANPDGAAPDSVFSRHLRFVTDELVPLIEREYPASTRREDRIVAGYSNGGAWAFAAAILRPDLFGNVLAMSAGAQWAAEHAATLRRAKVFAGAGLFEPGFLARTRAAAEAAEQAGAEVRMRQMISGHSPVMWEILFAEGTAWLLPPQLVAD
jgi:enterochelin esterase-like enzyme